MVKIKLSALGWIDGTHRMNTLSIIPNMNRESHTKGLILGNQVCLLNSQ